MPQDKSHKNGRVEVVFTLGYTTETKKSQEKIAKEADFIKAKGEKNHRNMFVCKGEDAFATWMKSPDAKKVAKIHIVAHGNQEQVGDFNASGLAYWLEQFLRDKDQIKAITLHSCNSASPDPREDTKGLIFAKQLASSLSKYLKSTQHIDIRGSDGESFTDSEGRGWVLQEGVKPLYKNNLDSEQAFTGNPANVQPRGTARPKFAAHLPYG